MEDAAEEKQVRYGGPRTSSWCGFLVLALVLSQQLFVTRLAAQCPEGDACSNGGCADGQLVTSAGQCGDCPVGTIVISASEGTTDNDCFVGGPGPDTFISGIAGDDFICGNGGDDNLQARQGNDIVCGGSGDDFIDAGSGDDYVFGGDGNDIIDGNNGDDIVDGGEGDDIVDGGNGNDVVYGGLGVDDVIGGNATDICIDDPPPTDPSCENAIYALAIHAHVSRSPTSMRFRWSTLSELGTVSFSIVAETDGKTIFIADRLPAAHSPHGAHYEYVASPFGDPGTQFRLVENSGAGQNLLLTHFTKAPATSGRARAGRYEVLPNQVPPLPSVLASLPRDKQPDSRRLLAGSASRLLLPTGVPVFLSFEELASWTATSAETVVSAAHRGQLRFDHNARVLPYVALDDGVLVSAPQSQDDWRLPARATLTMGAVGELAERISLRAASGAEAVELRTVARFEKDIFAATVIPMRPDQDVMHWGVLAEGHSRYATFSMPLELPGIIPGDVSVQIVMRSASTGVHGLDVRLGDSLLGDIYVRGPEPDVLLARARVDNVASASKLELRMLTAPEYVPSAIVYLDRFEIAYPIAASEVSAHGALLSSGNVFAVPVPAGRSGGVVVRNDGVLVQIEGSEDAAAEAPVSGTYYWFSSDTAPSVHSRAKYLGPVTNAGLTFDKSADLLVIAPETMAAQATRYAQFHENRGLSVQVVFSEVILDVLGGGYGDPDAIEKYLRKLVEHGAHTPPRYVLLLGNAHFDLRGATTDEVIDTPTRMLATRDGLYADDGRHADLDADGLPELAIGRISGGPEQIDRYLERLERFAEEERVVSHDSWQWIVDSPRDGISFAQQLEQALGPLPNLVRVQTDQEHARSVLIQSRDPVGYLGHGSTDQLGNEAWFTSADAPALLADAPILFLSGCAVGRHELPNHTSLAEALLVGSNHGPLSVWAPTGVSYSEVGAQLASLLVQELESGKHERMGDALLAVQARGRADPTERLSGLVKQLEYFGDPALPLRPYRAPGADAGIGTDAALTDAALIDAGVTDAGLTDTSVERSSDAGSDSDQRPGLCGGSGCATSAARSGPAYFAPLLLWLIRRRKRGASTFRSATSGRTSF